MNDSSDIPFDFLESLDFMGEEPIWFEEQGDYMLVCFNYIEPIDDQLLNPIFTRLRSICVGHGASGDPVGITADDGERHYAFLVPSENERSCYAELGKLSV